jgi:cytoplasmic iron level regulating protein YaaA (DUF328/UPF0246 family)
MIITLSPSKGQDFETPASSATYTLPQQLDQSQILVKAARAKDRDSIRSLMKVSDNIATLTVDRFKQFNTPFTTENARPALYAFKGDVYKGLEVDSYNEKDLDFAQAHLRILSGLYGYLRPLDLIQAYRLEMKTRLNNPRGANLYAFWGERITELLNRDLREERVRLEKGLAKSEPVLINLASNEYFKSINTGKLEAPGLNINFKESKDGKTRIIAVFAKRARGLMSNWIIKNKIETSEEIKAFDVDGYRFNASLSDQKQWTFSRPQP